MDYSLLLIGKSVLVGYARGQTVIALSSGEAEFYGLSALAQEAVFLVNLVAELGWDMKARLHTDSSAAKAIALRQGTGKVKHLEIRALHLQDMVKQKYVELAKIQGEENPADLGTRHLTLERIVELAQKVNLYVTYNSNKKYYTPNTV